MFFFAAIALFSIFLANVIAGAFSDSGFMGDTGEMLMLFAASLAQPTLVYDMGGKFDKSFNESAYNDAERYRKESGGGYSDFDLQSDAQRGVGCGMNPFFAQPTHYTARRMTRAIGIEQTIKEFPIGIQG